jgi:hypothetical protein
VFSLDFTYVILYQRQIREALSSDETKLKGNELENKQCRRNDGEKDLKAKG